MAKMYLFDQVCRLCTSSEFLIDLFRADRDAGLNKKIISCINLKICPGDGLPETICVPCKNTIQEYYTFKQKCLEADKKLRAIIKCKELEQYSSNANTFVTEEYLHESVFSAEYFDDEVFHIIEESSPTQNNIKLINENIESDFESGQCEFCGEIFTMKSALANHLLSHSSTRRLQCKVCSKSFSRSESHLIHMRSHMGIKPFICELCGSSSTKKQDLIRHLRIHSEEKNFSCPTCGRKFKRSSDIPSHMRTHTGARPYHCDRCSKSYTSHSGLRKHLKTNCKVGID